MSHKNHDHCHGDCDCQKGDCTCGEEKVCNCQNCDCEDGNSCKGKDCNCGENCQCGNECHCDENCDCNKTNCGCKDGKECTCGVNCQCEDCTCEEGTCEKTDEACECCGHEHDKSLEYLNLAKQIQADFENFRRHAIEDIKQARLSGQASVIEVFLPCLDTFKEAKKSINDENVLKGVEMIENNINEALKSLGVEKIPTVGEKFNPHLHNVIAVMKDENKENDIILEEYQAGYKFNDKVIRYAIVSVNKKED